MWCSWRPTMEHSSRFSVAHANHPKQKFCQCPRFPVRTSAREQFFLSWSRKWIKSVRPHDAGKADQQSIQFREYASDRRYKAQQTESVEQTAIDRMSEGWRELRRMLNKHLHDNTLLSSPSSADRGIITANEHTIQATGARRNLHNDGPHNSYTFRHGAR